MTLLNSGQTTEVAESWGYRCRSWARIGRGRGRVQGVAEQERKRTWIEVTERDGGFIADRESERMGKGLGSYGRCKRDHGNAFCARCHWKEGSSSVDRIRARVPLRLKNFDMLIPTRMECPDGGV